MVWFLFIVHCTHCKKTTKKPRFRPDSWTASKQEKSVVRIKRKNNHRKEDVEWTSAFGSALTFVHGRIFVLGLERHVLE